MCIIPYTRNECLSWVKVEKESRWNCTKSLKSGFKRLRSSRYKYLDIVFIINKLLKKKKGEGSEISDFTAYVLYGRLLC